MTTNRDDIRDQAIGALKQLAHDIQGGRTEAVQVLSDTIVEDGCAALEKGEAWIVEVVMVKVRRLADADANR